VLRAFKEKMVPHSSGLPRFAFFSSLSRTLSTRMIFLFLQRHFLSSSAMELGSRWRQSEHIRMQSSVQATVSESSTSMGLTSAAAHAGAPGNTAFTPCMRSSFDLKAEQS
jgi:hypothetical protein